MKLNFWMTNYQARISWCCSCAGFEFKKWTQSTQRNLNPTIYCSLTLTDPTSPKKSSFIFFSSHPHCIEHFKSQWNSFVTEQHLSYLEQALLFHFKITSISFECCESHTLFEQASLLRGNLTCHSPQHKHLNCDATERMCASKGELWISKIEVQKNVSRTTKT